MLAWQLGIPASAQATRALRKSAHALCNWPSPRTQIFRNTRNGRLAGSDSPNSFHTFQSLCEDKHRPV